MARAEILEKMTTDENQHEAMMRAGSRKYSIHTHSRESTGDMRTDDDCSSLTSGGSSNIDNNTSVLSGMERGGQEWEGNYSDGNSSSTSSENNVVNARRRTTSSVEVRRDSLSTRNVKGGSTA
ncbi:unnamed protein product, partial [Pylaiella littoralis]